MNYVLCIQQEHNPVQSEIERLFINYLKDTRFRGGGGGGLL